MKKLLLITTILTLSGADLWCQEVKEPKSPGTKAEEVAWKDAPVMALAFSPDDSLLAAAYASGAVKIWRTKDWKLVNQVTFGNRKPELSPQFGELIFASTGTLVVLLNPYKEKSKTGRPMPQEEARIKLLSIPTGIMVKEWTFEGKINRIWWRHAVRNRNKIVVLGAKENNKYELITIDAERLEKTKKDFDSVHAFGQVLSADAKYAYALERMERRGQPLVLRRVNLENKELTTYQIPYEVPSDTHTRVEEGGLAISEDGKMAAVGLKLWTACPDVSTCEGPESFYGRVYLFDMGASNLHRVIPEEIPSHELLFLDGVRKLLSATCNAIECGEGSWGTVKVWDVEVGKMSAMLQSRDGWVNKAISVSDRKHLIALADYKICIWGVSDRGIVLLKKI